MLVVEKLGQAIMNYFKNTELAKLYHISEKSVRNWIRASQEGKLDLQLFEENGRSYVANTSNNSLTIEQLVVKGKKYKNTRGAKAITPHQRFYDSYTRKQTLDIISNLTIHHELPQQYCYVNAGAEYWDTYASRLKNEKRPNVLTRTIDLLEITAPNIDGFLGDSKKVNVVDLGPGNGLPIRPILERLLKQGRLNRYIAIDISQDMLDILEKNIEAWFGDSVRVEVHLRDFSYERFDDLFAEDYTGDDSSIPANLVCLFGGSLYNFRSPDQVLTAINNSLGLHDIFLYTGYLDTPHIRRYFDFDVSGLNQKLSTQEKLLLDTLNIDESLYDVEQVFNEKKHQRSISARPMVDLSIRFELANGVRTVELHKDEPILLWRSFHFSSVGIINLFDKSEFDVLQATKSNEQEYILIAAKIKTS